MVFLSLDFEEHDTKINSTVDSVSELAIVIGEFNDRLDKLEDENNKCHQSASKEFRNSMYSSLALLEAKITTCNKMVNRLEKMMDASKDTKTCRA